MKNIKTCFLALAALAVLTLSAPAAQAQNEAYEFKIIDKEISANIRALGRCLRATDDDTEGPTPAVTIESCRNAGWYPYRWVLEPKTLLSNRYFLVHPYRRPDLCLDVKPETRYDNNPLLILAACNVSRTVSTQHWGVIPVVYESQLGSAVLVNAGVSAERKDTLVMTVNNIESQQAYLERYLPNDFQGPNFAQQWASNEIYCATVEKSHAWGTAVQGYSVGGQVGSESWPNCQL